MADETESEVSKKLVAFLNAAFANVERERREHFRQNPGRRPARAHVDAIITSCANENALVAGASGLVPGPAGVLVVLPEMYVVIRNQIRMLYDLGVAHGKEEQLSAELLLAVFASAMGGGAVNLATMHGVKFIVKKASLKAFQKVVQFLVGKITREVLKSVLARWLPIVGVAAMAYWSRQTTIALGEHAAKIFAGDIEVNGATPE